MSVNDDCDGGILNKQLALLQRLSESLNDSQRALLASDLTALNSCSNQQLDTCRQVAETWANLKTKTGNPKTEFAGEQELLREIQRNAADARVSLLRYAALLSGKRRTLDIIARLLSSSALTYRPVRSRSESTEVTHV
jgi:hypothetical protein